MKKKVIAVILMLAFSASVIYGCGLFPVNSERDMAQVIATVGDDDFKEEIYKKDLVSAYLSQGSSYMQNYGLSASETIEMLLEQLINNRIIIQAATKQLITDNLAALEEANGKTNASKLSTYLSKNGKKSENILKLLNVIDPVDPNEPFSGAKGRAESNVNKYHKETLDYYEEKIKEEKPSPSPSEEESPSPSPSSTPRPTPTPEVPPTESPVLPEGSPETETRIEAHKRFENDLKNQYKNMTAEEALEKFKEEKMVAELEAIIIEKYTEYLYSNIEISYESINERYENMKQSQKQQFALDLSSYTVMLEGATKDTFIFYNALEGYGYVKNLLIGFDKALSSELSILQLKEWDKSDYYSARAELLAKIKVKDLRELEEGSEEQLKDFNDINDFYNTLNGDGYVNTLLGGAYNQDENIFVTGGITEKMKSDFVNLIFQYGTDPGMFNNEMDYLSSPKVPAGQNEKYVAEFAEAARKVVKAGAGSYTMVGTDFGWHIILCTDVITKDTGAAVTLEEYNALMNALKTTKYDKLEASIKATTTFKLYNVIREEVKNFYFNAKVESIVKDFESKVEKFDKTYADLLALK